MAVSSQLLVLFIPVKNLLMSHVLPLVKSSDWNYRI